jgi:fucose permease
MERDGYAPDIAALSLSLFFLCLLVSRVVFSVIPLRLSNLRLLALSAAGALILNAVGLWVEPWVLPFVPLAIGPFFPAVVDLLSDEFPDELEGALAVLFAIVSVMLMFAHGVVGVLSDLLDLRRALALGPGALLLTLVLLAVLARPSARSPTPAP